MHRATKFFATGEACLLSMAVQTNESVPGSLASERGKVQFLSTACSLTCLVQLRLSCGLGRMGTTAPCLQCEVDPAMAHIKTNIPISHLYLYIYNRNM